MKLSQETITADALFILWKVSYYYRASTLSLALLSAVEQNEERPYLI